MRAWYWGLQIPEKSGRTFLTPDCKSGGTPSGLAARIQPTQPLHSANSATSFCQLSRFFQQTQPLLSANSAASFSQRNRFFQPTQPLRSANTATSFCQRSHFVQPTQPLHSANAATSFYQIKCLIQATNTPLEAHEVESSSQRSNNLKPAQSYLNTSAAVCSDSMKRMSLRNNMHGFISLLYRANSLKEKLFFFILIPLISHSDLTI